MGAYNKYEESKNGTYLYGCDWEGITEPEIYSMKVEVLGECRKNYYIRTLERGKGGRLPYVGTTLYVSKRDVEIVK